MKQVCSAPADRPTRDSQMSYGSCLPTAASHLHGSHKKQGNCPNLSPADVRTGVDVCEVLKCRSTQVVRHPKNGYHQKAPADRISLLASAPPQQNTANRGCRSAPHFSHNSLSSFKLWLSLCESNWQLRWWIMTTPLIHSCLNLSIKHRHS